MSGNPNESPENRLVSHASESSARMSVPLSVPMPVQVNHSDGSRFETAIPPGVDISANDLARMAMGARANAQAAVEHCRRLAPQYAPPPPVPGLSLTLNLGDGGEVGRLRQENAQLGADNARLLADNAQLAADNARLLADNAQLGADNARLLADNARLNGEVAETQRQLKGALTSLAAADHVGGNTRKQVLDLHATAMGWGRQVEALFNSMRAVVPAIGSIGQAVAPGAPAAVAAAAPVAPASSDDDVVEVPPPPPPPAVVIKDEPVDDASNGAKRRRG